jgi:voltage-gated potassium channel
MALTRKRLWTIINPGDRADKTSRIFDIFILTLIFLNALAIILGTIGYIQTHFKKTLQIFEIVSITVFTIEYLLRIWLCTTDKKYKHPIVGRLRFAMTFYALIDLISIAPFYIPFFTYDLRILRIIRFLRILRILKLERYTSAFKILKRVIKKKKEELVVFVGIFSIILILSSVLVFYVENPVQNKVFTNIPATMVWAIALLTAVGSKMQPITLIGKFMASIISMLGILLVAVQTAILASGFTQEMFKKIKKTEPQICPHCKKKIK